MENRWVYHFYILREVAENGSLNILLATCFQYVTESWCISKSCIGHHMAPVFTTSPVAPVTEKHWIYGFPIVQMTTRRNQMCHQSTFLLSHLPSLETSTSTYVYCILYTYLGFHKQSLSKSEPWYFTSSLSFGVFFAGEALDFSWFGGLGVVMEYPNSWMA